MQAHRHADALNLLLSSLYSNSCIFIAERRPLYIYQGDTLLASGEEGAVDGVAATISADIEDISKGDVYIYGGSQNKDIFGIFADYYDPTVIVYRNVSGSINYTGTADTSNMKIVFTDTNDGTQYKVDYGKTYSVELRQNREYNITIEGVDMCALLLIQTLLRYISRILQMTLIW